MIIILCTSDGGKSEESYPDDSAETTAAAFGIFRPRSKRACGKLYRSSDGGYNNTIQGVGNAGRDTITSTNTGRDSRSTLHGVSDVLTTAVARVSAQSGGGGGRMHLRGGGTNAHDDSARRTALYGCIGGGRPGFKPVPSRWSHGLVRGLPPKPRRVVKAPARHNHRRGLPMLLAPSTLKTHTK